MTAIESFMMRIKQIIKSDLVQEILYFDTKKPIVIKKIFLITIGFFIIYYCFRFSPHTIYKLLSNKTTTSISKDYNNRESMLEKLLVSKNIKIVDNLICDTFFTCVMPSLQEEIFFRFVLLKTIFVNKFKMNIHIAIFLSSVLFGVIHYINIIVSNSIVSLTHIQVIDSFICGMLFGYSYYYTNSILSPIMLHFLMNFMFIFDQYLFMK